MLYEMLTGTLPYTVANAQAMMRAKTTSEPDPPRRYRSEITPGLEEIVLHAIARSPRDRYKDAAELLGDLKNPAEVVPGSRTAHVHAGFRISRRTVFAACVIAVLLLLAALIGLSSRTPPPSAAPRPSYRGGAP